MERKYRTLAIALLGMFVAACGGGSSPEMPRATIEGFITDVQNLAKEGPSSQIPASKPIVLAIYGQGFNSDLAVELGGKVCMSNGDEPYDNEEQDSTQSILYAECPAQPAGSAVLNVFEHSRLAYSVVLEAIDADTWARQQAAHLASLRPAFDGPAANAAASMPSARAAQVAVREVTGRITADRPAINTEGGNLLYDADKIITFPVRGVVVQLVNPANDAVLQTVASDGDGKYLFRSVALDQELIVRVKAQVAKTRAAGVSTGPQYNFMVRDNASGKFGESKPLYTLEKKFSVTADTGDVNLNATLGFNDKGELVDAAKRQSAAFAILDVIYNAASGIEATDPNIYLPDLHVYWSANNTTDKPKLDPRLTDEEAKNRERLRQKMTGKIVTSHFQSATDYPGLFLLGQINVDTDEFDRGVVGHEFGHYLQHAASYDASPGGSHSDGEYKDPSLSYSEGFGTAIGGLLAKSKYYTDSKGKNQGAGSSTDLEAKPAKQNGFYSESSVAYLLYQLGNSNTYGGFPTFWKALTAMSSGYDSSTVFSFLDRYIAQGKATQTEVLAAAKAVNIRTVDPLGTLPAGDPGDKAIDKTASGGADDLEKIYLALLPQSPTDSRKAQNLTPQAPTFCVNSELPGANDDNGLGVSRRFYFKAPYTGSISYKFQDRAGADIDVNAYSMKLRDGGTGKRLPNGNGSREHWNVKAGTTYSLTLTFDADKRTSLKDGENFCDNQLSLWNFVD